MKKEEVKRLFDDENFMAGLNKVDSMEALQKFLLVKGVMMNLDDMDVAVRKGAQAELTEDELRYVSGGVASKWIKIAWDCLLYSDSHIN